MKRDSFVKFLKISFQVIVALCLIYAASIVWRAPDLADDRIQQTENTGSNGQLMVSDKDGTRPVKDQKMSDAMRELEEARQKAASREEKTKEDLQAMYERVWSDIQSRTVDADPSSYKVTFYDVDDVPLVAHTFEYQKPAPEWIDDRYVIYQAGYFRDNLSFDDKSRPFKNYALLVFDTETGDIVKKIAEAEVRPVLAACFDSETRLSTYRTENKYTDDRYDVMFVFGSLDENFEFHEEADSVHDPKYIELRNFWRPGDKRICDNSRKARDGMVVSHGPGRNGMIWGEFLHMRPDGTERVFTVNMHSNPRFKYDNARDAYFLAVRMGRQDHRVKIFYYDADFQLIESFVLPPVALMPTYPNAPPSFFKGAKGGFISRCGPFAEKVGDKTVSVDQLSPYLCLIKKDGTLQRLMKGDVGSFSISPSGCRAFGYVRDHKDQPRSQGKNFMIDLCVRENEQL